MHVRTKRGYREKNNKNMQLTCANLNILFHDSTDIYRYSTVIIIETHIHIYLNMFQDILKKHSTQTKRMRNSFNICALIISLQKIKLFYKL